MVLSSSKNVWICMTVVFALLVGLTAFSLIFLEKVLAVAVICMIILSVVSGLWDLFRKAAAGLSSGSQLIIFIILICAAVLFVILSLHREILVLLAVSHNIESIRQMIQDLISSETLRINSATVTYFSSRVSEEVDNLFASLAGMVFRLFSKSAVLLGGIFIICPGVFFLWFGNRDRLESAIASVLPDDYEEESLRTLSDIVTEIRRYINVRVVELCFTTCFFCLGLKMLGLPQWLFIGVLCGICMMVPYIGPVIAVTFAVIIGLTHGTSIAAGILVLYSVVILLDYVYFLRVADKNTIHPLIVIPLALVFYELFNVFGMILCVPIFIIFRVILKEIYEQAVATFPEPGSVSGNDDTETLPEKADP